MRPYFEILFDGWWASMNIGLKQPIAWNNTQHAPSWQLYLHCRLDETASAKKYFVRVE